MTHDQIASRLEQAFSKEGFAVPSVAKLKQAAGVSLRTLYRYFPSKEAMVIGALQHRHARYLAFLTEGEPLSGENSIRHLFHRLSLWMEQFAPNGCMSMNAFVAFPNNTFIQALVTSHKQEMAATLARRSGCEGIADELLIIHEGASAAWPILGKQAINYAEKAALQLIQGNTQ